MMIYKIPEHLDSFSRRGVDSFDGMLNKSAAVVVALACTILRTNKRFNSQTTFFEIGVYKGKFIALIEEASKGTGFGLVGIDPFSLVAQSLKEVNQSFIDAHMELDRICLIEGYSLERERVREVVAGRDIVLVHIDGSHREQDVFDDLTFVDEISSDDAIVVCDDFWNKSQLGVTTAVFRYVLGQGNLKPFMLSNTKLYLCRQHKLDFYRKEFEKGFAENNDFSLFKEFSEKRKSAPWWHTEQVISNFNVLII